MLGLLRHREWEGLGLDVPGSRNCSGYSELREMDSLFACLRWVPGSGAFRAVTHLDSDP